MPRLGGHAAVLEHDRLLEGEQHLLAKIGRLVAQLQRGEHAPFARDDEAPLSRGTQHPPGALAERLVGGPAAEPLQLGLERQLAPAGHQPIEPGQHLAAHLDQHLRRADAEPALAVRDGEAARGGVGGQLAGLLDVRGLVDGRRGGSHPADRSRGRGSHPAARRGTFRGRRRLLVGGGLERPRLLEGILCLLGHFAQRSRPQLLLHPLRHGRVARLEEPLPGALQIAFLRQRQAKVVLCLAVIGGEIEGGLEAAGRFVGRAQLQEDESQVDPQGRIGRVVLDQPAVDRLGLLQLPQLEEREPKEVARPLVARLVAQRLLQELPRPARVSALQGIGGLHQVAVELLVLGCIRVVSEDPALVQCARRGGIHHGAPCAAAGAGADSARVRFAARLSW